MEYQVGDRVLRARARQEGSFRVIAKRKVGPWWEYDLESETDQAVQVRVAESALKPIRRRTRKKAS